MKIGSLKREDQSDWKRKKKFGFINKNQVVDTFRPKKYLKPDFFKFFELKYFQKMFKICKTSEAKILNIFDQI